jgi:predicted chitinase
MNVKINPKQHLGKTLLEICKDYNDDDLILPDYQPVSTRTATVVNLTLEHLMLMAPSISLPKAAQLLPDLNKTLNHYGISKNLERVLFFMANLLHESGETKYTEEIASGVAYESRTDLGNTAAKDGDGPRHKGMGLFQITGVTNQGKFGEYILSNKELTQLYIKMYDEFPDKFGNPVLRNPRMLTQAPWHIISAGWFWRNQASLNPVADSGNFYATCVKINGGTNGLADRIKYLNWCKVILAEFNHLSIIPGQQYKISKI